MLDTKRQREAGWSGEGGGRGVWGGHLPCLADGRHGDVSPPYEGTWRQDNFSCGIF